MKQIEKERRWEELKKVEESLNKSQQVKFLASVAELDNIKNYAQISGQSQSEFIRTAIREKIRRIESQYEKKEINGYEKIGEDLSLEELKKIRKVLEKLEKKQ